MLSDGGGYYYYLCQRAEGITSRTNSQYTVLHSESEKDI